MAFKPVITLSLVKTKKSDNKNAPTQEPTPDYVRIAEEAATRLGKKLVLGAIAVVATYVVLATAGAIATNALDNSTN